MINFKFIIPSIFCILCLYHETDACTSFILKKDSTILLAKNLDWIIGDGSIFINAYGIEKESFSPSNPYSINWTSKFGSVTFNHFGKEFPLGGMNQRGLVIEELNYSPSQYPESPKSLLNEFQWIQYHLDNSESVKDVIESLDKISISPFLFKLHYMICDASGAMAIIEFIEGNTKIYTGKEIVIPVLTNNSYENLLSYIQHYAGFGGERIVSNNSNSQERFVRAATMVMNIGVIQDLDIVKYGFEILNSVRQEDTQWSIVYDISNRIIYYKTKDMNRLCKIRTATFSYFGSVKVKNLKISKYSTDMDKFETYTDEKNRSQLETVFNKYVDLSEIEKATANSILNQLIYYSEKH